MKSSKYICIAFLGGIFSASIHNVYAVNLDPIITLDACVKAGLTMGASCTCSQYPSLKCAVGCETAAGNCTLRSGIDGCQCENIGLIGGGDEDCASRPCENTYGSTNTSTGVQTGHTQVRDATTCKCNATSQTVYRCGAGWYDISNTTPATSVPTCNKCPTIGNNAVAGQSNAGAKLITSCYVPAYTNITDNTGTYQFTQTCKYSN